MNLHPQARTVRGSTVEEALEIARRELGVQDVRVLKASRMRRGGVGGFFAKELGVELLVAPATMQSFEEMLSFGRSHAEPETSHEYVTEAALALIESAVVETPVRTSAPTLVEIPDRFERPTWATVSPDDVVNPPVADDTETDAPEAATTPSEQSGTLPLARAPEPTIVDPVTEANTDAGSDVIADMGTVIDTAFDELVTDLLDEPCVAQAVEAPASFPDADNFYADIIEDVPVEADPVAVSTFDTDVLEAPSAVSAGNDMFENVEDIAAGPELPSPVADAPAEAESDAASLPLNDVLTAAELDEAAPTAFDLTATLGELLAGSLTESNPPLITEAQRDEELNVLHSRLAAASKQQPAPPTTESDLLEALQSTLAAPEQDAPEIVEEAPAPPAAVRPRLERDAEKWNSSRALREQHARETAAERETVLEVKDSQIEAFRQRYLRPAKPVREPAPSTQSRQMIASLGSIGIPSRVMHAVAAGATLREALSPVRVVTPTMEGVTLVIGHGPLVRQWAMGLAVGAGMAKDAVVFASMSHKHHGDLVGVEQLEEWRAHNLATPVIVALDTHSPGTNEGYVKRMIAAVRADEIRLVLDADDERSARLWADLAPNAVLDVVRTRHAKRPGAFLQLDLPVATVDGEQASASSLALALLEHAAR